MREESRPIVGPVLGIIAGALPTYWAARELWVVWRTSVKSKLVGLLVGKHTKVTPALIATLREWFAAVTVVEALVVVFALLLLLYPRRHYTLSGLMLLACALGLGLLLSFPYGVGTAQLWDWMIICPVLGFLGAISGLVFRSDLEFARSYGFD
jgi:hypothetical protein